MTASLGNYSAEAAEEEAELAENGFNAEPAKSAEDLLTQSPQSTQRGY
jgi:hypothetical protein